MFTSTIVAILSVAAILVEASHDISPAHAHQKRARSLVKKSSKSGKRCKVKSAPANAIGHAQTTLAATTTQAATSTAKHSSPPAPTTTASPPSSSTIGGGAGGVIKVVSDVCGASGASSSISKTNGPNGQLSWLNCGVAAGGWNPPPAKASDIIFMDLKTALQDSKSPFQACKPYVDMFNTYGDKYGLPPILLASIAMQESSCNPGTTGGAGEQGLMQITVDKCGGAPGGDCKEPNFNIGGGAKYFADTLSGNNGNIFLTLGQYNGWFPGMTVGKATAAANTNCCRCQQNLDYLHQTFNGWLQNVDPYATNMGQYFNLNRCGSD